MVVLRTWNSIKLLCPCNSSINFPGYDNFLQKGAASCLWLASKLEESPRKARQVLNAFHKIECRMQNLPIEHLEINSQVKHPPSFPWNNLFIIFFIGTRI